MKVRFCPLSSVREAANLKVGKCMKKNNLKIFELQKDYYNSGATRTISGRIEQLKKLKRAVKEYEMEFIKALNQDFGKSEFESYVTEIGQFYNEVELFIRKLRGWMKPKKMHLPIIHFPAKSKVVKEPYGVTLLLSPFNYPFGLTFTPLVGMMAAGNCVMIKPSEYNNHFVEVLTKMMEENFEERYIYVCDPFGGKDTVDELMDFPYNYVFFTGSSYVGKIIMQKAAKNLTPVTLELGGKSPCIVTADANLKMAAKRIVWGKFLNAGQTCVAPDYIWVEDSVKSIFLEELKREIVLQYGANPKQNEEYCGMITAQAVKRLKGYLEDGTIYYGGEYDIENRYFAPTILTDMTIESAVMKEEIFGPILPVMGYSEIKSVIQYLKEQPSALALYVFTEKRKDADYIINEVPSGAVLINDTVMHVATSVLPFGGVGNSGMGMYHGRYSLDTFTHTRSVMERKTWVEFPLRFPPYKNKINLFRKLFK